MDKYERYQQEQEQQRRGSSTPNLKVVEAAKGVYTVVVLVAVALAAALAVIYGLTRFVKWAWYQ